ncbi:MAG: hypothetical protein HYZ43_04850 [Flavobacteriia bacterium]|nr:hypothetical protein [Flavobacteriia bacterium]
MSKQKNTVGWAMTFERENAVWFAMLLDDSMHGKGLGSVLLKRMQTDQPQL